MADADGKPPGPYALLSHSRKTQVAIVGALTSLIAIGALRFGLQVNTETMAMVLTPIVAIVWKLIESIAREDAASKAAGAGMTTTSTQTLTPQGPALVTKVEPDPSGKP